MKPLPLDAKTEIIRLMDCGRRHDAAMIYSAYQNCTQFWAEHAVDVIYQESK